VDRLCGGNGSAERAIETEDRAALLDSLILCKFVRGALGDFYSDCAELLSAVTGQAFDEDTLRSVAQRVVQLRKAVNIREGWVPEDDTLPERFLSEALTSGPARGARLPRTRLAEMVGSYNLARGWSEDGTLPASLIRESLAGLDLSSEWIEDSDEQREDGKGVGR
jgi:aldehyde:ferredoxin oxidoreductase